MPGKVARIGVVVGWLAACSGSGSGSTPRATESKPVATSPPSASPASTPQPSAAATASTPMRPEAAPTPAPKAVEVVLAPPAPAGPSRKIVKGPGITITETSDGRVLLKTTATWGEAIDTAYTDCSFYTAAIPVLSTQLSPARAKLLSRVCTREGK